MQQLPTVDYRADDAAAQFVESLRNTGFGVLKNHPIPQELVESIYKMIKNFSQPTYYLLPTQIHAFDNKN